MRRDGHGRAGARATVIAADGNAYLVEIQRERPWRSRAIVLICAPGHGAPEPLFSVAALSGRGAKRRAARLIALRVDSPAERG